MPFQWAKAPIPADGGVFGFMKAQAVGEARVLTAPLAPLTGRIVIVTLVAVIALTVFHGIAGLLRHENLGLGYLPRSGLTLFWLLTLLNLFVRRFRPCWSLSPAELLALFACLLVTGSIPGQEFGIHFYLNLLAFLWHSRPDTPFAETILPHLDPKFLPGHRWNDPAVYLAYQGLPEGVAIPWRDWLLPLCLWTPYFLLLYGTLMLTAGLFARRWEDEERLLYPLAQVPAAFADAQQSASLLRHPLFWLGFVAPCVLWSFRGLHQYFPAFPDLNLQPTTGTLFSAGPATVFNDVPIEVRTDMIGLAYLLPLEVSLSGWLFYLLRRLQWMGRIYLGVTTGHAEFFTFQTMGAYAALALLLLWRNRTFLRHLVKSWGQSFPSSANPPLPPRWLLLGFLFGWVGLMVWCRFFGLAFPWGLVLLGSWFLGALVVARIIAEAGLFIYGIPLSPPGTLNQVLFSAFGIDRIGVGNAVKMLAISWCQIRSSATNVLPNFFYAYKLGAVGGVNRTQLTGLLMTAVAISFVTTHLTNLSVIYRFGVGKLSSWAQGAGFNSFELALHAGDDETEDAVRALACLFVGGGRAMEFGLAAGAMALVRHQPVGLGDDTRLADGSLLVLLLLGLVGAGAGHPVCWLLRLASGTPLRLRLDCRDFLHPDPLGHRPSLLSRPTCHVGVSHPFVAIIPDGYRQITRRFQGG